MKNLHTFSKFLFDLILSVVWVYVPMYHFELAQSENAVWIWVLVLTTLITLLVLLHRRADRQYI